MYTSHQLALGLRVLLLPVSINRIDIRGTHTLGLLDLADTCCGTATGRNYVDKEKGTKSIFGTHGLWVGKETRDIARTRAVRAPSETLTASEVTLMVHEKYEPAVRKAPNFANAFSDKALSEQSKSIKAIQNLNFKN
ncbi:predicted protein [Sclerotinia sclerotiorum 1980 UF-70]|uniref:Uncharacterized protein n=1 Tax=Sclerotinia sclerotiorum (strain ATCC 18683 / 1980 / Ss-1) TaxID=665079 RepID=A7EUJ7_SCLS1|nr:predicted protein [Sclerotinia sclerotiorum 1980 UF-70]EDN93139.1 predicted protein [Sclerotinia sclerotiorum 1980 UF-70]